VTSLPDQFHIGDLFVDLAQVRVNRGDVRIPLPKLSFDVLVELARTAPRVASIDALMSAVWPGLVVNPETVAQRIKLLRSALSDDPRTPRYIESLRGRGYRLLPEVKPAQGEPAATQAPDSKVTLRELAVPPLDSADGTPSHTDPVLRTKPRRFWIAGIGLGALIGLAALALWYPKIGWIDRASRAKALQATVTGLPSRTIAVMPFDDLSINHDNGQLALALPEMVLQRLGTVQDLIVIARSSSFAFIGQRVDAREIGRRLDARYLVEGSLQRMDNRLRITAQLVDAQTGKQLRSLSFDRNLADVFELQDDIAGQLATALKVQLMGADMRRVDRSRSTSLDAYLDYLEAQSLLNRWTVKEADAAVARLEHAIKLDPNFAVAYAELARARWLAGFLRTGRNPDPAELLPLINKALQLDPKLGEAYAMRGQLKQETDPAAAEADFRKGIELAPNYGPAYEMYGEALAGAFARPQEGNAMIERAMLIDPIAPRSFYVRGVTASIEDNSDEAEQWFLRALAVRPEFAPANARLGLMRLGDKKVAEAIKFMERALRVETQAQWMRDPTCALYLDLSERQAAGEVAAGSAANSPCAIMLATYDRKFDVAASQKVDVKQLGFVPAYAYWVSFNREVVRSGAIDATIASLRKQLSFFGGTQSLNLPDEVDLSVPLTLAYLLKLRNDRVPLGQVVDALKGWADRHGGLDEPLRPAVLLLSGDREAALQHLMRAVRAEHRLVWWVAERDPLMDELRADPRRGGAWCSRENAPGGRCTAAR